MRNYVHTIDLIKIEQRSIKFTMYNTYDYLYNYKINCIKKLHCSTKYSPISPLHAFQMLNILFDTINYWRTGELKFILNVIHVF